MQIYALKDLSKYVLCGIYKIDFPNGKSYIGQSKNIYKRILEHNSKAKKVIEDRIGNTYIQTCEYAIAKYGLVKEVIILELGDISELIDKEIYWILKYKTNQKEYGYNLILGKDVFDAKGIGCWNASFTESTLKEIIDLIKNHCEISLQEIANKYNVHVCTIYRINQGNAYVNNELTYPLRPDNNHKFNTKNLLDYFDSEEDLIKLKTYIKYNWYDHLDDIAKKFNIPRDILTEINLGKKFSEYGSFIYPIRNYASVIFDSQEPVLNILYLLKDTSLSMKEISKKCNVDRKLIGLINQGKKYPIQNYNYPARRTYKND